MYLDIFYYIVHIYIYTYIHHCQYITMSYLSVRCLSRQANIVEVIREDLAPVYQEATWVNFITSSRRDRALGRMVRIREIIPFYDRKIQVSEILSFSQI